MLEYGVKPGHQCRYYDVVSSYPNGILTTMPDDFPWNDFLNASQEVLIDVNIPRLEVGIWTFVFSIRVPGFDSQL